MVEMYLIHHASFSLISNLTVKKRVLILKMNLLVSKSYLHGPTKNTGARRIQNNKTNISIYEPLIR